MVTDPQLKPKSLTLLWANTSIYLITPFLTWSCRALMHLQGIGPSQQRKDVDQACPHHSPPWSQHSVRELLIPPPPFFLLHFSFPTEIIYIYFYICSTFVLFVSLFVIIISSSINSWYLYSHLISFVWSQAQHLTLLLCSFHTWLTSSLTVCLCL